MQKIYIDRSYLSEKLGIDERNFVICDVKSDFDHIEFMIALDSEANDSDKDIYVDLSFGNQNIRRLKLN